MKFQKENTIKLCYICNQPCTHLRIYTLSLIEGLKNVEIQTTHLGCRKRLEKVMNAQQKLKDEELNLEYHIFNMNNPAPQQED